MTKDGQTPLSVAVGLRPLNVVELLLANGANVNAVGFEGWTALHVAVQANNIEAVKLLLANKPNVNAVDNDGRTPLHMASRRGYTDIVELLRQHGGQDITPANTAILDAAEDGDLKTAETLLESNPALVFTTDKYGWTPLLFTVRDGHEDVAQLLLTNKAEVNASTHDGETTLHWAVMSLNAKHLVKLLIAAGADVNAKNKDGMTPLHLAVLYCWQDPTIAELLLDKGADVNSKDKDGETPLAIAMDTHADAVAELLRHHGSH